MGRENLAIYLFYSETLQTDIADIASTESPFLKWG